MFFFVGGISNKVGKVLQPNYGDCLNCHSSYSMELVEMGKTFEAFFIPIYTFQKREILLCKTCRFATTVDEYEAWKRTHPTTSIATNDNVTSKIQPPAATTTPTPESQTTTKVCQQCGGTIKNDWSFCPKCGIPVD